MEEAAANKQTNKQTNTQTKITKGRADQGL